MQERDNFQDFDCAACGRKVTAAALGTHHRNHCPFCLASKHVDLDEPGDRSSDCGGLMKAVGLTLKEEGTDKWGKPKRGEVMLIHHCTSCGKISVNRIAGDDDNEAILELLGNKNPSDLEGRIGREKIRMLDFRDEAAVRKGICGGQ